MTTQVGWGRKGLAGGGLAALAAAAMVASCGGGGGGSAATQATIDSASVNKAVADVSAFVTVCQGTGGAMGASASPAVTKSLALLGRQMALRAGKAPTMRAQAYTSVKPADTLGDCGGRFGYPDYSHTNGVTTAVLTYTDYCTLDSATGNKEVLNGSVSFVNTATPTASGPITTKWEGSSANGVTAVARKPDGSTASSQTVSFDKLAYAVGVPGSEPTSANPDRLSAAEFKVVNNTTAKTYRQTDYSVTMFVTPAGDEQMSLSGRGYRSDGSYFDISTTTPMVVAADGRFVSGSMTFTGANGNNAVATLVPGSKLQANLVVNGTPVSSVPACTK